MANIISDETIEYVGILAKLELNEEEKVYENIFSNRWSRIYRFKLHSLHVSQI